MCGIAGKYNLDGRPADAQLLSRMASLIRHRGPDDEGVYIDGPLGMTMRRLSIIDVASGHQPICNEDGSIWIVFNGEIYNYVELYAELVARGHRFKTQSDTEVIVHLYEEYGQECLQYLRGMFAFALWDAKARRLFIARDRLGKKPLFYALLPGRTFVFASELKALLQDGDVERSIDLEALNQYLGLLYIPAPACILKAVRKLPAGHFLVCDPDGVRVGKYWEIPLEQPAPPPDPLERFREILSDAVKIRLRSDVPLGAFLSGGIDSTTVVTTMAQQLQRPVVTASIGFKHEGYNELPHARAVAERLGTEHHERWVTAPSADLIDTILWHLDEPFADSSAIPTYFVSKAAREHVTVALSGDGGDELFGGYSRHRIEALEYRIRRAVGPLGAKMLGGIAGLLPSNLRGRNVLARVALADDEACARKFQADSHVPECKAELYSPALKAETASFDELAPFRQAFRLAEGLDPLSRIMFVDVKTYLADDILTKVDRMSMAHSLEVRVPLLDHKLVEFAVSLPPSLKVAGDVTKILLRQVLNGDTPQQVLTREKHGFISPIGQWLRGELAGYVEETLFSARARERGYFDAATVRRHWDEHRQGRRNREHEIWMLLGLEVWHRLYVDGATVEAPPR